MGEMRLGFAPNNLIRGWGNMGSKKWEDFAGRSGDGFMGTPCPFPSFVHI